MSAWVFDESKLSSKWLTSSTRKPASVQFLFLLAVGWIVFSCGHASPRGACAQEPGKLSNPVVLFDSYHAHNFLDRGMIPGEHNYHHLNGFRRAVALLRERSIEVGELIVGPITPARLEGVKLIVVNLPSADRPPWLVGEIEAVVNFVRAGGGIIFITDHSNCYYHQYHLLPLWEKLGLTPTFETVCERESNCQLTPGGNGWLLVRQFESHPVTESIRYMAIQTGGRVVGQSVIARTSPKAWADAGATPLYAEGSIALYGDFKYSASEEAGPQGILLARTVGRGRVLVISDQNALGDMLVSYGDNWRVWLNACKWAGSLNFQQLTQSSRPISKSDTQPERAQVPTFDQIMALEPDRNAQPQLPAGSWYGECWEPLTKGEFHWGGDDPNQLYYLWCWLNRWTWTTAHEGQTHPYPQGRCLLLAVDTDLSDTKLRERIARVLAEKGKVVLLAGHDHPSGDQPDAAAIAWRENCLKTVGIGTAVDVAWSQQPIGHWQISGGGGQVILIPDARPLRNASFLRPERAPSAVQAKWLGLLYRWLFEQP